MLKNPFNKMSQRQRECHAKKSPPQSSGISVTVGRCSVDKVADDVSRSDEEIDDGRQLQRMVEGEIISVLGVDDYPSCINCTGKLSESV